MRQLYIFTAGVAAAREHLDDSIHKPVPASWLDEQLDTDQAKYLKSLLPDQTGFYAWGAVPGKVNIPTWETMRDGDVVLTVYDDRYHFISTVIGKVHSSSLAKRIWGLDQDNQTWEYMYLLTSPKQIEVLVKSKPAVDFLRKGYRGFTRISPEKTAEIRKVYGSLEKFIEKAFASILPKTVLQRDLEAAEDQTGSFDPSTSTDARKKVLAEITRRRGQPKFRKSLLNAYEGKCAVTGCDVQAVLEAAHIMPYQGDETNHVTNGLLLRADIHTLFDLGDLMIDANGVIHISAELEGTVYNEFKGKRVRLPADSKMAPHKEALARKFRQVI